METDEKQMFEKVVKRVIQDALGAAELIMTARKAAKVLFGDGYGEAVAACEEGIRSVMERDQCSVVLAANVLITRTRNLSPDNHAQTALLMATLAEMIDQEA